MSSVPLATTILGWTVVVAVGGITYLYYSHDKRRPIKVRSSRAQSINDGTETRSSKSRRNNTGVSSDGGSATAPARSKKKQQPAKAAQPAPPQSFADHDNEEAEDNSWAHELAEMARGSSLAPPKRTQSRQKTVKQRSANKVAADLSTETSTTTGADADDDRSLSPSPELAAQAERHMSDMLEPAAPGPSVLRLTEPENQLPPRQKPAPKVQKQDESKKQRQNKKKAEEKKQQNEEIEKIRRAQREQQMRTAREARGEPAKNGLAAPAPTKNAWDSKPVGAPPVTANGNGLLDTFTSEKINGDSGTGGNKSDASNGSNWQEELPSEAEQLRRIMNSDESAWKTVSKKGKKSRKNTLEMESGGAVQPVEPSAKVKEEKAAKATTNGHRNGTQEHTENTFSSPLDSDWCVA
jgi:hypothetical protein